MDSEIQPEKPGDSPPSSASGSSPAALLDGRVVRAAEAVCQPLYPVSRILPRDAAAAAELLADAERTREAAAREAEALVNEAQDEVARRLAEAEERAAQVEAEAEERGRETAANELGELLERLDRATRQLQASWIDDVAVTGLRFARAILDVEFVLHPERVGDLVRQALEKLNSSRHVTITLHPDDATLVESQLERLKDSLAIGSRLRVISDPESGRRGVRIETDRGLIDAALETQLQSLARYVTERFTGESS